MDEHFIQPWQALATECFGDVRARRREKLNMRFTQHHSLALAYAAMPMDESVYEGQDRVLKATLAAFETARRNVVRHDHATMLRLCSVAQTTSRAFAGSDTPVEARQGDVSSPERESGDSATRAMQGYLFQVDGPGGARVRRWVCIRDGMLYAAVDDLALVDDELVADLNSATVVRCRDATACAGVRGIRHGFQVVDCDNNGVSTSTWQADTRDVLDEWIVALATHQSRQPPPSPPATSPTAELPKPAEVWMAHHEAPLVVHPREAAADEFIEIVRQVLPCSVATYLNRFVVDATFSTAFLTQQGASAVEFSPWVVDTSSPFDGSKRYTRRRRCILPVDSALSQGTTRIHATDVYQVAGDNDCAQLRLLSSDESLDVPYGSYFAVQSRTTVRNLRCECPGDAPPLRQTEMIVEIGIYFSKRTMFRRMIELASWSEAKKSFETMAKAIVVALGTNAEHKT
ncbi:hypothetical protein DYB32_008963 [Aphanomyces invadans]|uniref:VASt domain-containing protein n=1 Tax=Aphanomyces invadans TaxID=157072 RepID=A0A3R6Y2A6_9STRA|nr:hypothetical protein DYB32_008963 [Aphanomyces invadans]